MARIDGGEIVVRMLEQEGIRVVFTLHGGHLDAIYQASRGRDIRWIDTRHEQAAGHAADGWARTTGEVGVALVTAGPGVTDVVTAVTNAYLDCVPTLFLAAPAELRPALERALAAGKPACVNVMTDPSVISPVTVAMVGGAVAAVEPAPAAAPGEGKVRIPYYENLE